MCGIAGAIILNARRANLDLLWDVVARCRQRGSDSFGVVRWSRQTGWQAIRRDAAAGGIAPQELARLSPDATSIYLHTSRAEPA